MNLNLRLPSIWRRALLLTGALLGGLPVADGAEPPDGGQLFVRHCAPCHGEDGRARTRAARKLGVKDLSVSTTTDAQIEKQIRDGKKDEQGVQRMPAFAEKLQEKEIVALVSRVKLLRKPQN